MADMEDYLEEGFDPRSVTMPRLRSILVQHNIDYPSTAKKGQLVELVSTNVLPLAPKLRAQRARAKRSSMGIVNAGSAEDDGRWDDQDLVPPKSTSKRGKSPRKSSAKIKSEDDESELPVLRGPAKRNSRSVSRAMSRTPDYEAPKPSRASRRTITPSIKAESDEDLSEEEGDESVFTEDNPFQGGSSSPPPRARTPSYRRRTAGEDITKSAKASRRRTDEYDDLQPAGSYGLSVPKLRHKTPEPELEPGEEFTPDEQLELEEAASQGDYTVVPRQQSGKVARKSRGKTALSVFMTTLLVVYMAWYRQEKMAVGYCGLGRPATQLLRPEWQAMIPDAALPYVEPQCERCPQHATCHEDFSVECDSDFILRPHPLSLAGLVPLPPTCEPDGEKARRVQSVADKAVEELRERRAKYECGELVNDEGQKEDSPAIAVEELKQTVSRKRSKRLNSAEFDGLWAAALGDLEAREEIQVQTAESTETTSSTGSPVRQLSSSSLARVSLTCAIKRSVRLGVARFRLAIGVLSMVVLGIFYLRARYRSHVAASAKVPALVDLVLERLASQKELGEDEIDDPWLFLPNLRDDVLRSVHSLSEREKIWQRVKAVVDQNSNVRTSQGVSRGGDVGRTWEWIGPLAGDNARRRRSGRVSWGPDIRSESPEQKEMAETKKWDEPRPIY